MYSLSAGANAWCIIRTKPRKIVRCTRATAVYQIEYIAADGYGFDYVMVFKLEKAGVMTDYATGTVKKIMAAGFKVRVYFSCSKEEVFCEMRAPVERLMQFADQVQTKRYVQCSSAPYSSASYMVQQGMGRAV